MKKLIFHPLTWLALVVLALFREFIFFGRLPLPVDTLVGAYLPWLDYKWGYAVGVPVKNALTSDAFSQFFIWKNLAVDLFRQGIIPLWNRFSFSGTPLLATFHAAVLFPANLLLLLPINLGWGLYILFSLLAAAFSMYLFLRGHIKSKAGQFIGSVVYALAGPMTTWSQFGTAVWAASFLPLILYCLDRIVATRRPLFFPLLSLLIGLLIFAGHVQLLTYASVVAPLYFFYRQKKATNQFRLGLTIRTAFAAVLGVGLGAVQLLPSLEFFSRSIRVEENYASTFNYGLSPLSQVIRLWAADFFGNPVTSNHFSQVSYHEYSSYLGVLSLPLIAGLLFSKEKKSATFFIWLFFVSLFLAFDNPVSHFIFSLPLPLLTYSSASRLFFLTNLAAAVLVGLAIDNLVSHKKALLKVILASLIVAAITLTAIFFVDSTHRLVSLRNSVFYLAFILALLIAGPIFSSKRNLLVIFIALLFSFDLGRYYLKYNPFVSPAFVFPPTPVVDFLKSQPGLFRLAREDTNLLPANSWTFYRLESVEGYDPLFNRDYAHYFHRLSGNSYFNGLSRYALIEAVNEPFLAAANVKYFLTKNTSEPTAKSYLTKQLIENGYRPVFIDKSVTVYEDPKVKDRAYFVGKLRFAEDKTEMGRLLDEPNFNPTDTALVLGGAFDLLPAKGSVTSINYQGNSVKITTDSSAEAFLVLSDAYDPGWQASINNQPTRVYQTNGAVRGIRVPAGQSQIIFKYEPVSFSRGLAISLFSGLISLIFFLVLN